MAQTSANQQAAAQNLTIPRGAALYIGAILGPGLLLLPGLAAAEAGPASILAWLGLLGLSGLFAVVFSALGRRIPSPDQVAAVCHHVLNDPEVTARTRHAQRRMLCLPPVQAAVDDLEKVANGGA